MFRDKDGNRLFRKVEVRIIFPDEIMNPEKIVQHANPRQGFSPDGLDELLMKITDQLDERFPWWEFKMTPLAPEHRTAKYVFTCIGFNKNYKPSKVTENVPAAPTV